MKKDLVTIVLGDSIAYGSHDKVFGGWGNRVRLKLANISKKYYFLNLGIPGQTSSNILSRMDSEISNRYNTTDNFNIIFSFGIKDSLLLNDDPNYLKEFKNNLNKIIEISKKYTKNIYFIGLIKPDISIRNNYNLDNVTKINNCLKTACKRNETNYIELMKYISINDLYDGLHPSDIGHEKISKIVLDKVFKIKGDSIVK